jgi:hypothetical protein
MIRAHMATFPVRSDVLPRAIADICAQVDRLFLVLNEYLVIPDYIKSNPKVEAVIPAQDLKDVGKFYFPPAPDDIVFFVDDDVKYPENYVVYSLGLAQQIGLEKNVFGYHCSIYEDELSKGANSRHVLHLRKPVSDFLCVDQVATNAMIALGRNVAPLPYMQGAQKFVDVRYAKWLFEQGVDSVALPRERRFLHGLASENPEDKSIWATFTRHSPQLVLDEIKSFAGKFPKVGKKVLEV